MDDVISGLTLSAWGLIYTSESDIYKVDPRAEGV